MNPTSRPLLARAARVAATAAAIVLLLWAIAVPSFPGAHPPGSHPDESAARATLSLLVDAQRAFRSRRLLDRDGDGEVEFGWFTQLAGAEPPLLSARFAGVQLGCVERGAYVFQLWLPAANGTWIREGSQTAVDADAAEQRWCAYAWPRDGEGAQRVLFVDESGRILRAANDDRRYSGRGRPVPVDAALPSSMTTGTQEPGARRGRDGALWLEVR